MTKQITILLISVAILFGFDSVKAQYEARLTPGYLQPEVYQNDIQSNEVLWRLNHLKPQKVPASAWKMYQKRDRILQSSGIELINCTNGPLSQDETWMVINPNNPKQLIASSNDTRYNGSGGYRMAAYYSHDGGSTWKTSTTPNNVDIWIKQEPGYGFTNFDPGLAFDHQNNLYYCYGFAQMGDKNTRDNGVFVCRSTDGGASWQTPVPVALASAGTTSQPFHDKFLIAADFMPNSPYKGYVYVAWTVMYQGSEIVMATAEDGENFNPPISISKTTSTVQSALPTVGPNGEVYVVFHSDEGPNTHIFVNKSIDGGKSTVWFTPKKVQTVRRTGDYSTSTGRTALLDKQDIRMSSYGVIDVDRSQGSRRGWVFIVQSGKDSENRNGIFLAYSTDGGEKWTSNIRIDNNKLGNDCFMPALSVDPITGTIAVLYYSSQNDPTNTGCDAYLAVSRDGAKTFNHIRLTDETWYFDDSGDVSRQGGSLGNYWGDYTSVVAYDGKIYPCFWMPAGPKIANSYHTNEVYTAIISPEPNPPTDLSAVPVANEPTKVTIRWTDPVTNKFGEVLGAFKIFVLDKNNNKIGEVDKGVQMFEASGLIDGEQFTFNLKTHTSDGLESSIVSISGIAGGSLKPKAPYNLSAEPDEKGIKLTWMNPNEHTDGSFFHDFEKISIYSDGQQVATFDGVAPGEISTYVLEVPTKKFYLIKLKAVGKRGTIETESDFSEEILAYSGAPYTTFIDRFDDEAVRLPVYTLDAWAITNKAFVSEPNCLTDSPDANYPRFKVTSIIFAPAVIAPNKNVLAFDHIGLINVNDHGEINISDDNMKTWKSLRWINKNSSDKFQTNLDDSQWESYTVDLAAYNGKTIYLQFKLVSASIQNMDGWYIDNLRIDNTPVSVQNDNILKSITINSYPNPATDHSTLEIATINPSNSSDISLYNALGSKISSIANGYLPAGLNTFKLNLAELANGVYYANVTLNGVSKVYPIVVNK